MALLGSHELHISASLTDFPAVVTASETIIPISFARCPVQVLDWVISDTMVPSLQTVTQMLTEPELSYLGVSCGYSWASFEVRIDSSLGVSHLRCSG